MGSPRTGRLADACVGLLAGAVADRVPVPTDLFLRYAEAHAGRVLPPLLITIGKGMARKLSVADFVHTLRESQDVRAYLSRTKPDEARWNAKRACATYSTR